MGKYGMPEKSEKGKEGFSQVGEVSSRFWILIAQ
jgi:hypothetical protein